MEAIETSRRTRWQAGVLSLVAGYTDTVGFLTFHAFAGLITGNTVLLGIALSESRHRRALVSAVVIASFLVGMMAAKLLRALGATLVMLLGLEAGLIIAAALLPPKFLFAGPALSLAMGLQNASAEHFAGVRLNTVVMTGDMQKMVNGFIARLRGVGGRSGEGADVTILCVYGGYLGGALTGGAVHVFVGRALLFAPLLLPLALLRFPMPLARLLRRRGDGQGPHT